MSKVFKLGITDKNNSEIKEVASIEVLANKGVVGDRHFDDFNDPYCQLSLIESENIDYYNSKYGLNIPYINFRRNIVTKGIKLNELIGKKIKVGDVSIEGIDLCRPCRHLTEMLDQEPVLKKVLKRSKKYHAHYDTGEFKVGDQIKIID